MKEMIALFAVFGLDWGTKHWAEENLPRNRKKEIVKNHLYFWHIKNRGMAYNRFEGKRKGILWLTGGLLSLYGFFFAEALRGKMPRKLALPIAITLGGGLGNFWERLKKGSVTDFLYIHAKKKNMPIFNLADIAITLGAIGVIITSWRKK